MFLIFSILFLININLSHFAISSIKSIILLQLIYFITTIIFWQQSYPPKLEDISKMKYEFVSSLKHCLPEIFIYLFLAILMIFLSKIKILKIFSNYIVFLHLLVLFYNIYQCHYHLYHATHQWFAFILGWFSWVAPISLIHILYCTGIFLSNLVKTKRSKIID